MRLLRPYLMEWIPPLLISVGGVRSFLGVAEILCRFVSKEAYEVKSMSFSSVGAERGFSSSRPCEVRAKGESSIGFCVYCYKAHECVGMVRDF